jgi:hypothetical protein
MFKFNFSFFSFSPSLLLMSIALLFFFSLFNNKLCDIFFINNLYLAYFSGSFIIVSSFFSKRHTPDLLKRKKSYILLFMKILLLLCSLLLFVLFVLFILFVLVLLFSIFALLGIFETDKDLFVNP